MTPEGHMLDVLVIGAGQAGLMLAWQLRDAPLRLQLVDRAHRIGDSWRHRYDSLVLFSPRSLSALPGLPFPGEPEGYPTKDEAAEYLEAYARTFRLPVRLGTEVRRLWKEEGLFHAETDGGERLVARAVVLAAGAFQEPMVPGAARELSPEVVQLTAATYRNPRQLPAGRILVVGDGATGRQVAYELAREREVWLATGRRRVVAPQRFLGRDGFWWLLRLGVMRWSRESAPGRLLRRLDPFPGLHLRLRRLRRQGIRVAGRLREARGRRVVFADGRSTEVDGVLWATGYRERSDWVDIPAAKDETGRLLERRGVTPVPGLYFVGRDWQWTRGSAVLLGVHRDAAYVARKLVDALTSGTARRGARTAAAQKGRGEGIQGCVAPYQTS